MTSTTTADVKLDRTIPAPVTEVFDAWLDSTVPGSPWHEHEKLIVTTAVDGLWHWRSKGGTPHFGRFIEINRPHRLQYSWMSPYTLGQESTVTVTFDKKGEDTLMTLVHSGLPNADMVKAHDKGWATLSEKFTAIFEGGSRTSGAR